MSHEKPNPELEKPENIELYQLGTLLAQDLNDRNFNIQDKINRPKIIDWLPRENKKPQGKKGSPPAMLDWLCPRKCPQRHPSVSNTPALWLP